MVAAAIAFLIALIAAMILTPVARRAAHRLGAIDHALGSRRVHGRPIPRLGGLAVVAAFYLALVALAFADPTALALFVVDPAQTAALLLGGLVIAGLGLHDDLHGATAGSKLFVEFAVAGLLYAAGFRIDAAKHYLTFCDIDADIHFTYAADAVPERICVHERSVTL